MQGSPIIKKKKKYCPISIFRELMSTFTLVNDSTSVYELQTFREKGQ